MADTEYGPGGGPPPLALTDEEVARLLAQQSQAVLATLKRSGLPHLINVLQSWDPAARVARISTTEGRVKVGHLRRDARAALHVTAPDFLAYGVAEGSAELSAVSTEPGDATGRELAALRPPFPDPSEEATFFRQMVADRRLVIRLHVDRLYARLVA
ncbi:TIGR03618 family F420-dependent PPOX class oxidoreductase [Pseudonocardia nigra]|uniref:TIGR03618 family F420-dependent PPOX class oxidoreductase n=1 Tax=Pseudonocardia nigra TaxID=1921578 RepID=UPI001C5F26E4|nr:TIGR03618 family F420-dependent PPOX class oxidoreductase [Pseudonocardia nigra]